MVLVRKISQHRRDFTGTYACEHCGYTIVIPGGYDDAYFHQNVIPAMRCRKCDKTGTNQTSWPDVPAGVNI